MSQPNRVAETTTLTRVQKPFSTRELCAVDISTIRLMILNLPESLWEIEDARKANQFFCFHHTRHIVLRFIDGNSDPRIFTSYPIWDVWSSRLLPVFHQAIEHYGIRQPIFPKVMFARLQAGHIIDRHVDGAGSNELTHKIHVPIQTNEAAVFTSNGETSHLQEGFAYEANNIAPHSAENRGDADRIHLIFEVFDASE